MRGNGVGRKWIFVGWCVWVMCGGERVWVVIFVSSREQQ